MASLIKGIPVTLISKTSTGVDAFNRPITAETTETVENVLVAPLNLTDNELVNDISLNGKKMKYQLAIPKGDSHVWEDQDVEFFGERWHVIGFTAMGIEALIPLDWNRKAVVERIG